MKMLAANSEAFPCLWNRILQEQGRAFLKHFGGFWAPYKPVVFVNVGEE